MKTKNLMVSFIAIVTLLALASVVAAEELAINYDVTVEGIYAYYQDVSVVAGEDITVKVYFTANVSDTDVTVEAELEGEKVDTKAVSEIFDVENGMSYRKVLTLKVPFELKDSRSDDLTLSITIDGKNYRTELDEIILRVQRPSYNAVIKSVVTPQNIDAGETIPVDIVLKNVGYNDLDDLYVSVKIPALGIEKTGYFGDLVAIEHEDCSGHCDDDEDTVSGRIYLEVPYEVKGGVYSLEVEVSNDDTTSKEVRQISINNDFSSGNIIVTSTSKSVSVGEEAEYSILIVNPTDQMKVYRIVTENTGSLTSNTNEAVVAVPAGSSKTIKVTAVADAEGDYTFNVNILSGSDLVEKVSLTANVKGISKSTQITSPIVVLTIILAIVFIVLLIVLIVLLGRKPEKSEEFGESYY